MLDKEDWILDRVEALADEKYGCGTGSLRPEQIYELNEQADTDYNDMIADSVDMYDSWFVDNELHRQLDEGEL